MICMYNEVVQLGGKNLEFLPSWPPGLELIKPEKVEQRADEVFLTYPQGEAVITMDGYKSAPWVLAGHCVHPLFGRLRIYWKSKDAPENARIFEVETLITATKKTIVLRVPALSANEAMAAAFQQAALYPLSKTIDDHIHCIHTETTDENGELHQEYWEL